MKTQTFKKKGKPIFKRITQPNSLRSFHNKEQVLNLCSIFLLKSRRNLEKNLFPYFMEKFLKFPKKIRENFNCEICDYNTLYYKDLLKHNSTLKHQTRLMEIEGNNNSQQNSAHHCQCCNYNTIHKSDFIKHEKSKKHLLKSQGINEIQHHICNNCNKSFLSSSGLWKHQQKCSYNVKEPSNTITSEMFMEFFKQSKELQNVLIEQNKELQNKLITMAQTPCIVNNNNTLNNNNQQFNLQFFLNETCKDAINITDFVNSLELKVEDFEATGKLGYVEGISRIIINEMKDMEVEKRPMHCTDFKRETLYIKDDNVWIKENQEKNKFKKVVKKVAQLNLNQFPKWQAKYPDCVKVNTKENDEFIKLSLAALGSRNDEEEEKFMDKILKNVLKEVIITKKS